MIKIENLSYGFPQKELYNKISFTLTPEHHCAFIGVNGSGKSSLINILMDPEKYMFTGKLEMEENLRIGYVSQFYDTHTANETTVFDYIADKFITLQNELDEICEKLETSENMEELLEIYQNKTDAFEALGGYDYESKINKILNLAGLRDKKDLYLSQISGGEFKLIQVICQMLFEPDLLIMDEPDMFLDFEHLVSLKDLINNHKGALLVITHNRFLLSHCFNKIIHLEGTLLQEFEGTYIDYNFSLLLRKVELKEEAFNQTEEIARNEVIIDNLRQIASINSEASRGRALGARVAIQNRLLANRIQEPFIYVKQPNIKIHTDTTIDEHQTSISVKNFNISFEDSLISDINFEISSNEKVAIIGENGTGKTTLLKAIYKNQSPEISTHGDLKVAYLSQNQIETLNGENNMYDEFFDLGLPTYDSIREHLKSYSFEGEILEQKISTLSGGEKNILQLAKIACMDANFLIMDEPTSHLDTYAQIALEKAISNYEGGILMISHDFYTVANTVDYVLIIADKSLRKMKLKKFKQKIYAKYFSKDYLLLEEQKTNLEMKIEKAITANDFATANELCETLEGVITKMQM